jgi:hypothetical protein
LITSLDGTQLLSGTAREQTSSEGEGKKPNKEEDTQDDVEQANTPKILKH